MWLKSDHKQSDARRFMGLRLATPMKTPYTAGVVKYLGVIGYRMSNIKSKQSKKSENFTQFV